MYNVFLQIRNVKHEDFFSFCGGDKIHYELEHFFV